MVTRLLHEALTDQIIGIFYQVHAELGEGHLESVYANAMAIALTDAALGFGREVRIAVYFRGRVVGVFKADALVESVVMLEYKAATGSTRRGRSNCSIICAILGSRSG